ncbi:MAG: hypothetical protein H0U57_01970 [Tatlockia sp.]|nr:hypothetical protein [Tatlockia sp.]
MQFNSTSKMLDKMKSDSKSVKPNTEKASGEFQATVDNQVKSLEESELVMKNIMEMCLSPKGKPKLNPSS